MDGWLDGGMGGHLDGGMGGEMDRVDREMAGRMD